MIQRIQTIWLLLAMACSVMLLYFPVWKIGGGSVATGMDEVGAGTHFYLLGFAPVLFITHAIAVYSFRNRKKQLRICNINILLFVVYLLAAIIILQVENQIFTFFNPSNFRIGFLLPLIGIFMNWLAKKGIRKDEELIRSMDRLR